jgi:signal transduction histidine kinase
MSRLDSSPWSAEFARRAERRLARPLPPIRLLRYGVAIAAVAAAAGVSVALRRTTGPHVYYGLYFAAVAGAAFYGGLGPGLLATMFAVAAAGDFLLSRAASVGGISGSDVVSLAVFALVAPFMSLLSYSLKDARVRAEAGQEELREQSTEIERQRAELEQQVEEMEVISEELAESNASMTHAMAAADRARADTERAREDAERANMAKTEFLATMSHELRTPLNATIGYAELLETGIRGPVTPAQVDDLRRIRRASTHLLGLINDVLNYAKLEAVQVQFAVEPLVVDELLAESAAMIEPQARTREIDFTLVPCGRAIRVLGDRDKVLQVVLNLLVNAVKFTRAGGHVTLSCRSADDEPMVQIAVSDTGRGIAADQLERIFEPFVQVGRSLAGPDAGTGLGLAISRELARGMSGDLTVDSLHGEGSTFALWLPRASPSDARPIGTGPRAVAHAGGTE